MRIRRGRLNRPGHETITHLHVVPRSKMLELWLHPPHIFRTSLLKFTYFVYFKIALCSDVCIQTAFSVISYQLPVTQWRNIHIPLTYYHSLLHYSTTWFTCLLFREVGPKRPVFEYLLFNTINKESIPTPHIQRKRANSNFVSLRLSWTCIRAHMHSKKIKIFSECIIQNVKCSLQRKENTSYGDHVYISVT
jgi:hypothetical protein